MKQEQQEFDGLFRHHDRETAKTAGRSQVGQLSELKKKIITVMREAGQPVSDHWLEQQFRYAPGTVRKRRCELADGGLVVEAGYKIGLYGCKVTLWRLK